VQVLGLGSRWLCCGLFVGHCCDVWCWSCGLRVEIYAPPTF
jgi:hypothetical protein